FSVLEPVPLRKIERHTRVPRNSSKCWSSVFAMAQTLTKESRCIGGTSVERSTSKSPSSLSHTRFHGRGLGAGPSILSPGFKLARSHTASLLPWQGQAIMFNSGFHAVRQPRCVQTALREKNPSCE